MEVLICLRCAAKAATAAMTSPDTSSGSPSMWSSTITFTPLNAGTMPAPPRSATARSARSTEAHARLIPSPLFMTVIKVSSAASLASGLTACAMSVFTGRKTAISNPAWPSGASESISGVRVRSSAEVQSRVSDAMAISHSSADGSFSMHASMCASTSGHILCIRPELTSATSTSRSSMNSRSLDPITGAFPPPPPSRPNSAPLTHANAFVRAASASSSSFAVESKSCCSAT
mmetsp:Transcript_9143/g.41577  ORF Transcript_9143/g.41577 Transcript_9143/m.41577 type:complete len:232 (-) Transcript_9143:2173-2868(-)